MNYDHCTYITKEKYEESPEIKIYNGDILLVKTGSYGKCAVVENLPQEATINPQFVVLKYISVDESYLTLVLQSGYARKKYDQFVLGTAIPTFTQIALWNMMIPLPPIAEQRRIVQKANLLFTVINRVDTEGAALKDTIQTAKSKILNLALSGRLTSRTSHYQQLPDGWELKALEDVLDYEQPQKYIVDSTDYSDSYATPVLTAGKSFVIGYTNEVSGIFTNVPVIIFDDFTTDSKYVDFPFKVKSSAMKILHPRDGINLKYVAYFMSVTRLAGNTHKRYWISEYSRIMMPVPPKDEQDRIVSIVEQIYSLIDNILK